MPDASTIDPTAVLQRVEKIEAGSVVRRELRQSHEELRDTEWLCRQLRTALADTRRVDFISDPDHRIEHFSRAMKSDAYWCVFGTPCSICENTLRQAIDAAMAATPREE